MRKWLSWPVGLRGTHVTVPLQTFPGALVHRVHRVHYTQNAGFWTRHADMLFVSSNGGHRLSMFSILHTYAITRFLTFVLLLVRVSFAEASKLLVFGQIHEASGTFLMISAIFWWTYWHLHERTRLLLVWSCNSLLIMTRGFGQSLTHIAVIRLGGEFSWVQWPSIEVIMSWLHWFPLAAIALGSHDIPCIPEYMKVLPWLLTCPQTLVDILSQLAIGLVLWTCEKLSWREALWSFISWNLCIPEKRNLHPPRRRTQENRDAFGAQA